MGQADGEDADRDAGDEAEREPDAAEELVKRDRRQNAEDERDDIPCAVFHGWLDGTPGYVYRRGVRPVAGDGPRKRQPAPVCVAEWNRAP